jgi:hypothetical protein
MLQYVRSETAPGSSRRICAVRSLDCVTDRGPAQPSMVRMTQSRVRTASLAFRELTAPMTVALADGDAGRTGRAAAAGELLGVARPLVDLPPIPWPSRRSARAGGVYLAAVIIGTAKSGYRCRRDRRSVAQTR